MYKEKSTRIHYFLEKYAVNYVVLAKEYRDKSESEISIIKKDDPHKNNFLSVIEKAIFTYI